MCKLLLFDSIRVVEMLCFCSEPGNKSYVDSIAERVVGDFSQLFSPSPGIFESKLLDPGSNSIFMNSWNSCATTYLIF